MKKLFSFLFSMVLLSSCDDGDIIITSFEFDDVDLQFCEGAKENEFVFFKINESNNEAISYNFISEIFSDTIPTTSSIIIDLTDGTNDLIYRTFNIPVTATYYCSNVPSSDIRIIEELIGSSGTAEITNEIITEDDDDGVDPIDESGGIDPLGDIDNDQIPNYQDSTANGSQASPTCPDTNGDGICDTLEPIFDTDGDGIPNYKDQDDDNDNILTSVELQNGIPNDDSPRDTDGDGIPDYLEEDDDNDGVLTRNEDADQNGNPRDDRDASNNLYYLDNTIQPPVVTVEPALDNTVQTTFRATLEINNLILNGNTDNFQDGEFKFGFRDRTIPKTTKKM
ncbi:hypothetical protein [Aquimarina algiphila]|uniref:hypothetical protein n=1 Tax=Aquimarina algiphila TaxID=2047982 RepID=UPI002492ADC9|nr:hypothetical protein [Aquimarina algiphila]